MAADVEAAPMVDLAGAPMTEASRRLAAALAGARLAETTVSSLREALPAAHLVRLAVPATADVLLLTSNLLLPGHLTLSLQPRAHALAGRALDLDQPVRAVCGSVQHRPLWLDLEGTLKPEVVLALPLSPVPANAREVILPLSPAPANAREAALAASRAQAAAAVALDAADAPAPRSTTAVPAGQQHSTAEAGARSEAPGAAGPAGALVVAYSRASEPEAQATTCSAEALAIALAPHLAAVAPRVVHEIVTAVLGPHACMCGCHAPASARRVYQEGAPHLPRIGEDDGPAPPAAPAWAAGHCRGAEPGDPEDGAAAGAVRASAPGGLESLSVPSVGLFSGSLHDSVMSRTSFAAAAAAAKQANLAVATAAAANEGGDEGEAHTTAPAPSSPPSGSAAAGLSKAVADDAACSAQRARAAEGLPGLGGGSLGGGGGGAAPAGQGWLLAFADRALERRYCLWQAAQKLRADSIFSLFGLVTASVFGFAMFREVPAHMDFAYTLAVYLLSMAAIAAPAALARLRTPLFMCNRGRLLAALHLALAAFSTQVFVPAVAHQARASAGGALLGRATWFARVTYAEGLLMVPLLFPVRLSWLAPLQAAAWALAAASLPGGACSPHAPRGCLAAALATQLLVGVGPSLAIQAWAERRSRAAFLRALAVQG